jgi:hypothetical protein
VLGGFVDMTGRVLEHRCRRAGNEETETINDESGQAPLRRETPEAQNGLLVHGEGVLFSCFDIGAVESRRIERQIKRAFRYLKPSAPYPWSINSALRVLSNQISITSASGLGARSMKRALRA